MFVLCSRSFISDEKVEDVSKNRKSLWPKLSTFILLNQNQINKYLCVRVLGDSKMRPGILQLSWEVNTWTSGIVSVLKAGPATKLPCTLCNWKQRLWWEEQGLWVQTSGFWSLVSAL